MGGARITDCGDGWPEKDLFPKCSISPCIIYSPTCGSLSWHMLAQQVPTHIHRAGINRMASNMFKPPMYPAVARSCHSSWLQYVQFNLTQCNLLHFMELENHREWQLFFASCCTLSCWSIRLCRMTWALLMGLIRCGMSSYHILSMWWESEHTLGI